MTPMSRFALVATFGATAFASAPALHAAMPGAQGMFADQGQQIATGSVRVERVDGRMSLILDDDFNLANIDDARVVLARANGTTFDLGTLRAMMGGQVYPVPGGLSLSEFDRVVITSGDSSIQLASADLS
ncbi:MAG: hypothetical protein AAF390_17855 [Pseudomonadota bacterium]